MADSDPLSQMFNLFAAPLAGTVQSFEQFRKGVDEFLRGVENFNRTMENLNETAQRMNTLLIEVEEPIKAAVPQMTRAINNADEMMQVVSGPAMAAAPGLARLAESMNTPAFRQLPDQIATFSDVLVDMSTRVAPLTQFAETAGGLFGLRIPGTASSPDDGGRATSRKKAAPGKQPVAKKAGPKKSGPQKSASKKAGPKTSTTKSSTTKSSRAAPESE
jgi:hypothetical protein